MDLIINKVVELQVVHDTNGNSVIERLTCTSVTKNDLAVLVHACFLEALTDILLVCAVEYRGHYLPAKLSCSHTEMNFKHLTDVHT